ncbi:hypothetical protein HORM4_910010 [Vibrio harveyi]|nr:hypothetical protein HORM4_910010 [Vibrio harveyi]
MSNLKNDRVCVFLFQGCYPLFLIGLVMNLIVISNEQCLNNKTIRSEVIKR